MWPFNSTCQSQVRLDGKTAVITGANTGLGKETARDLCHRGAKVILACRNVEKANAAVEEIRQTPPSNPERPQFQGKQGELVVCKLDLSSFASVRACARQLTASEAQIHLLINNAGMIGVREVTEDGNELQLQSNHLGHFLLTLLLLPKMRKSGPGCRVVNVSSILHMIPFRGINFEDINLEKSYTPLKAYGQSKLANILFTKELARKLGESDIEGITSYSLHPGLIMTEELGVQTIIHCAVDEGAGTETGLYYSECSVSTPSRAARNMDEAQRLWSKSLKMVGLPVKENLAELLDIISRDILPSK